MKNGKCPTKEQKIILKRFGFDPSDWLISKNTSEEMVIVCRYTGKHRTIPKSLYKETFYEEAIRVQGKHIKCRT